tara:strand:+ start:76 stop:585 length:510 start_codon:yes stop_codon:yes gene_type:complete
MQKFTVTPEQSTTANLAILPLSQIVGAQTGGIEIQKSQIKFKPCDSATGAQTVEDALKTFLHACLAHKASVAHSSSHRQYHVETLIRKTLKALAAENSFPQIVEATPSKYIEPGKIQNAKTATSDASGKIVWGPKSQRFIAHVTIDGKKSRKRFTTEAQAQTYLAEVAA